jgi:hypothetical protein
MEIEKLCLGPWYLVKRKIMENTIPERTGNWGHYNISKMALGVDQKLTFYRKSCSRCT